MRHRIGMIWAAIITGVLFFPGAWVPAALALSRSRQASFPSCRAPAAVEDPGWRPATLTNWPMTVRGSSCGRLW